MRHYRLILSAPAFFILQCFLASAMAADALEAASPPKVIELQPGMTKIFRVDQPIHSVLIGNPNIANASVISFNVVPEFRREVQPPASLNGLDVPSRRAVFVPWKPSRRRGFGMGTRLSVEEPMLSTGLHLTSESTGRHNGQWDWIDKHHSLR